MAPAGMQSSGAGQGDGAIMPVFLHGERVAKQRGPVDFHGVGRHAPALGAPKLHTPILQSTANLRQGHLTISNRVVSSSCPIWTRTCCDNETRVAQRSFPDDHHRFPGPCL
jgi:hypothetical protein